MAPRDGRTDKGVSLARGPALILGSILLTFGLLAFLSNGSTPTDGFADGTVTESNTLFGFEVNGWTAFFTAVAGGLLLFGAAQHLLAKTMSLLVGLALGACSVIALIDKDDVLGLAAANGPTKLGWGAAAAAALVNALLPRKGHKVQDTHRDHDLDRTPAVPPRREVDPEPVTTRRVETVTHREPVVNRETVVDHDVKRETIVDRDVKRDTVDDHEPAVRERGTDVSDGREGSVAPNSLRDDQAGPDRPRDR